MLLVEVEVVGLELQQVLKDMVVAGGYDNNTVFIGAHSFASNGYEVGILFTWCWRKRLYGCKS